MYQFFSVVLLLGLSLTQTAFAFRCDHQLVQLGDRKIEVSNSCGDPDSIDQHYETKLVRNLIRISGGTPNNSGVQIGQQTYYEVQILVEEWVYDFGRRRFQQYLRFENGVLTEIKDLGKGKN